LIRDVRASLVDLINHVDVDPWARRKAAVPRGWR
jgi:hypothetical protein